MDSLRALLLAAHGYKTQLREFVSQEHTSKNKMLLAIRHTQETDKEALLAQVEKIKHLRQKPAGGSEKP